MRVHASNPSNPKAERLPQVQGQPELHSNITSQEMGGIGEVEECEILCEKSKRRS